MFDNSGQFQLTIHPNGRKQADEYFHNGQTWIEGRENSTYTINVTNNSPNRILAIISVDGLDILKGQPAGHQSQGYVIPGFGNISIPGWKVNNSTAAEFFFSKGNNSYVNQIGGNANNLGVIGAMIFKEKAYQQINNWFNYPLGQPTIYNGALRGVTYDAFNVTATSAMPQNSASVPSTGTGFGDATTWNTSSTSFVRENDSQPNAILAVFYDDAKALQRMGIQLRGRNKSGSANPFPTYNNGVTPPPGWTGY